jgi:hypothetical protein
MSAKVGRRISSDAVWAKIEKEFCPHRVCAFKVLKYFLHKGISFIIERGRFRRGLKIF